MNNKLRILESTFSIDLCMVMHTAVQFHEYYIFIYHINATLYTCYTLH